jgi:SAM-dependent methyltransferase
MSTAPDHVMTITTRGEFNPKLPGLPPNPSAGNLIRQSRWRFQMQGNRGYRNEPASPYEAFAFLYSRTMAEDFCRQSLPVYQHLALRGAPVGSPLLDVCCGSGQWARELTRLGYRVTGLDASPAMIRLARQTASGARFLVADARNFHFVNSFSGVISAFNSLAHASSAEHLLLIFRNVRRALGSDAAFVFDLSMEEAYLSRWRGKFSSQSGEHTFTLEPSYDRVSRTARNQIRIANRNCEVVSNNAFTISQHCYSEDEIRDALRLADFHEIESFDAEEDLDIAGERGRRFFRCR